VSEQALARQAKGVARRRSAAVRSAAARKAARTKGPELAAQPRVVRHERGKREDVGSRHWWQHQFDGELC